jgi:glutamate carboxypeptidase
MNAQLRPFLDSRFESMVDLVTEIVRTESPTSDKAGVDAVGAIVQRELRVLGADVRTFAQTTVGDHTLGVFNRGAGAPIAMILHVDTVHPLGSFAPRYKRENGRLYGPGIFDMKASSVITLYALRALQELGVFPQREIRVLFTSDEEIGSGTSKDLIIEQAQGAALVMVMEPALADGRLKSSRRAVGHFVLQAHGRAAHAGGNHELGVNAIWELAHHIPTIQGLTDYAKGTAATVGMIRGGTASNVIPDFAELTIDARATFQHDADHMTAVIRSLQPALPGARLELSGGFDRPAMECNAERLAILERLTAIAATTGLALNHGPSGAGSDASFTCNIAPTMDGLGAVGDGLHAPHEHILLDSLAERAALAAAILKDW